MCFTCDITKLVVNLQFAKLAFFCCKIALMTFLKKISLILLILFVSGGISFGQRRERAPKTPKGRGSSLVVPIYKDTTKKVITDSMRMVLDSLHRVDSIMRVDSIELMKNASIQVPAFSKAKDSLIESFADGHRIMKYYGDVTVEYDNMTITADYMRYDIDEQTVFACGTIDPATGELKGNPVMKDKSQGNKEYEMKEVTYNFKSKKAFIKNMVTSEAEGIIRGRNIKMEPDQSINITKGKYTVCDCEEPHYYLHLTAAKVMTKPRQNTVFGPAWPVVEGVPLFPIVLPFGFVPKLPNSRASGILFPTFGEEQARGFFVKDFGIYIPIGNYVDIALTGSYYSLGSWGVDFNSRYKWNYHFSGNISLTYSYDQVGIKGEPDFNASTNFKVAWSHSADSKAHPGQTFSASVNFSSPGNSRYNSHSVTEALNNQTQSSISFSRNWNGKFNLSINALHSQNSKDSSYAITLPNLTFSVSKFYPFKRKNRVGKEKFYEKFSLSYNTTFQNKANFKASDLKQGGFLDRIQNGMSHSFSIGLPNFTLLRYININPSISYGMNWFFTSKEKFYNEETGQVEEKKKGFFGDFGATHTYSGSVSMDTQIYGTFNFGKHRKVQAIRHIIKPSVSFSYSPEKGTYFNGWRSLYYTDNQGNAKKLDYNIYEGQMNSVPGKGQAASMRINIGNNLEAKIRDLRDTTGTGSKKVKILDQLNISTGYDFIQKKMDNVGITFNTNVFGKVGINGNLNFNPYAVDEKGQLTKEFAITKGQGLLRLTNASFSMSYSLSGKGTINGNDGSKEGNKGSSGSSMPVYNKIFYHPLTGEYIPGGWVYYMNPNSPWSLNASLSFNYAKAYQYNSKEQALKVNHNISATLSLNGSVKITPALSLNVTSGVDLKEMKITTTQISASYDLHCFNIQFSWVPMGKWQSWNFCIAANASALADLLRFRKSNSYTNNADFWR